MSANTNYIIDPYSPFFVSPADQPGNIISTVVLNGENYNNWSRVVTNALKSKNKYGFVDDSLKRESSPDVNAWDKCNSLVLAWLYNVIDPTLHGSVSYAKTARSVWQELEERYAQPNSIRIHQLKQEITLTSQNTNQTVTEYYTRLKTLWDELSTYLVTPWCICNCEGGAAGKYNQFVEDEKVHKFIMGLDPSRYLHARSAVLAMDPLPNLNRAYAVIIREERQCLVAPVVENRPTIEAAAFKAFGGSKPPTGQRPRCSCCQKTGHDRSQCYHLVGYPAHWNLRRSNRQTTDSIPANPKNWSSGRTKAKQLE